MSVGILFLGEYFQSDALLRIPEEVAALRKYLEEVLEENHNLREGLPHFTKEQTGKLLQVSKTTLEAWEAKEIFVPMHIGNKRLYSAEMIRNFSRHHNLPLSTAKQDWQPAKIRKLPVSEQDVKAA
jgi:hypothetical protein